jgi:hypothetical protein
MAQWVEGRLTVAYPDVGVTFSRVLERDEEVHSSVRLQSSESCARRREETQARASGCDDGHCRNPSKRKRDKGEDCWRQKDRFTEIYDLTNKANEGVEMHQKIDRQYQKMVGRIQFNLSERELPKGGSRVGGWRRGVPLPQFAGAIQGQFWDGTFAPIEELHLFQTVMLMD